MNYLGPDYSDNWKRPTNLYALASGIYPLIPYPEGTPSVEYKTSKARRQPLGQAPILWYEGARAVKPYIQGNYVFQSTRKGAVMPFRKNAAFLSKYRDEFTTYISSSGRGITEQMNRQVAGGMNEDIRLTVSQSTLSNVKGKAPESMEEMERGGRWKVGMGEAKGKARQYDFEDTETNRAYNTTKMKMTSSGHGMYGQDTALKWIRAKWRKIDGQLKNKEINEKQADQRKIDAGVSYFKGRLPQWNAHIRKAKRDLVKKGVKTPTLSAVRKQFGDNISGEGADFPGTMRKGQHEMFKASTGFMKSAQGEMTMQLFGSKDIFLTGKGNYETYQIRPYVQGDIGAFVGSTAQKDLYEYKNIDKLKGHIHYGYARTIDFGKTAAEQIDIESGIKTNMASFLQSKHRGGSEVLANDALRSISGSGITSQALRLRPTINLVQAGEEFNRGINQLVEEVKLNQGDPTMGKEAAKIKSIVMKNAFKFTRGVSDPITIWGAPYIAVFDSESLMSGRD